MIAVKVNASEFEGWFYEGAGIYRHVWLVKTSPLAIAPDGIFVYSHFRNNIPEGPVEIHIQTRLLNSQTTSAAATVKYEIIGPDGKRVGEVQAHAIDSRGRKDEAKPIAEFQLARYSGPRITQALQARHDG